jgi:RNA polymerase sigma-70 factor (ECF subfamily)
VIIDEGAGHWKTVGEALQTGLDVADHRDPAPDGSSELPPLTGRALQLELDRRVAGLVHDHFDFIWRSLRRLGVSVGNVDDAAQKVFWTAAQKMKSVHVEQARSFLFAIALRVASDERRTLRRRPEMADPSAVDSAEDAVPHADDLVEQLHARAFLDRILEEMPLDVRVVFVLFELEEMTTSEVAAVLAIPVGTVASRLRRGRAMFEEHVARFRARRMGRGDS